jgi:hypothetical protein
VSRRDAVRESGEDTGYWFMNTGETDGGGRSWDDCKTYSFLSAGGNEQYQSYPKRLKIGDRVFAYLSGHGYVGLGEVIGEAVPQKDFMPPGHHRRLLDLPMTATVRPAWQDPAICDWCVGVRWIHAVPRDRAVLKHRFRRLTFQPIRQPRLVDELRAALAAASTA